MVKYLYAMFRCGKCKHEGTAQIIYCKDSDVTHQKKGKVMNMVKDTPSSRKCKCKPTKDSHMEFLRYVLKKESSVDNKLWKPVTIKE